MIKNVLTITWSPLPLCIYKTSRKYVYNMHNFSVPGYSLLKSILLSSFR